MDNPISKIAALIILVLVCILMPVKQAFERIKYIGTVTMTSYTIEFVDTIRNNGIISEQLLNEFRYKMQVASNGKVSSDNIKIEHCVFESDGNKRFYSSSDIEAVIYNEHWYDVSYNDYIKVTVIDINNELVTLYGGYIKN